MRGRGDETFIAEGAGISTRHLFLGKKNPFFPWQDKLRG